jgi:hypothetical protein
LLDADRFHTGNSSHWWSPAQACETPKPSSSARVRDPLPPASRHLPSIHPEIRNWERSSALPGPSSSRSPPPSPSKRCKRRSRRPLWSFPFG